MALLGRFAVARPAWAVAFVLAISVSLSPPARAAVSGEYQVKAAFLFNFSRFVEWPPDAFPEASTPFVIGVLGEDPFGKALDEIVAREVVRHRPVIVRRFRDVAEITVCHILFIRATDAPRLNRILAELEGRPILTVGDADSFAASSGAIQFVLVDNRVRLRINTAAARTAKLSISSQLLRQAELVEK